MKSSKTFRARDECEEVFADHVKMVTDDQMLEFAEFANRRPKRTRDERSVEFQVLEVGETKEGIVDCGAERRRNEGTRAAILSAVDDVKSCETFGKE